MHSSLFTTILFVFILVLLPSFSLSFHLPRCSLLASCSQLSPFYAYTNPYNPGSSTPNAAAFSIIKELSPYSTHALTPLKDPDFFLKDPVSILPWKVRSVVLENKKGDDVKTRNDVPLIP